MLVGRPGAGLLTWQPSGEAVDCNGGWDVRLAYHALRGRRYCWTCQTIMSRARMIPRPMSPQCQGCSTNGLPAASESDWSKIDALNGLSGCAEAQSAIDTSGPARPSVPKTGA